MSKSRSLLAMILALAMAAPFAFAGGGSRQQLEAIARDLDRALGHRSAEVNGRESFAEQLVDAMNRERAANGLRPLRFNQKLSLAAGDRITDMFAKHYFDHVSPDGINPFTWVDKRGYDYVEAGENLAVGYRNAGWVVDGWMHSPAHRENILKADFDEVGVAIAPGSPTRRYAGPTVVAMYGVRPDPNPR
jgi:uncharacterized protein YkwD